MATCQICTYAGTPSYKSPCSECKGFSKYEYEKPMTNADRIRAMTDEELADALEKFCIGMADCSDCPLYAFGCPMSSTFNNWLEWLQQPAENPTDV